jgi:phytoene dehydrogenase-like protein
VTDARYDAVVVGSGPNGLAGAIALARAGRSVLVLEGADALGGGLRSSELTLPGFVHDECASVLALLDGSPFLRALPLRDFGLELIQPRSPLAHPLDDGSAVVLERSVRATASPTNLGSDAPAYARLMGPLVANWQPVMAHLLGPLRVPRQPLGLLRFGIAGILPATVLARVAFREPRARALLGGVSAHSILPLERPASAAFGLVLAMLAHALGWPVARGGSRSAATALVDYLQSLGGEVRTSGWVASLDDQHVPPHDVALLDLTPRQVLRVAGHRLPAGYRRALGRYRYGPGICKVDWALDAPIPWTAAGCRGAGTVHVGGTLEEVAAAEAAVWRGQHPRRPFVILVQPTVADPSRAPSGKHTAWAYCHVPHGSTVDMTSEIEAQVERFAPGFTSRILGRVTRTAAQLQAYNPNYVGGDINGGVQDLFQLWTRPVARLTPYATPDPGLYLCSSSTPPGGGVHGMCGAFAARAAAHYLRRGTSAQGRRKEPPAYVR